MVKVTQKAKSLLSGAETLYLRLPKEEVEPAPVRKEELDPASQQLFQRLRLIRKELAARAGIAPFQVFHDTTLREMATARPVTREQMRRISGVGLVKLERYGEAFLEAIRLFQQNRYRKKEK